MVSGHTTAVERAHVPLRRRLSTRLRASWARTARRLAPLGGVSLNNQVTMFVDGDDAYDAMLAAIARASARVWLETYIFEPDRVGQAFLAALERAAERGVEVVLIVDAVGSSKLSGQLLAPLKAAGARVLLYNPLSLRRKRSPLHRDHRKILVVDAVAFCGGMNISEDYAGVRWGRATFRDTHALLEGPCVADFARIVRFSALVGGTELRASSPSLSLEKGIQIQVLQSDVPRAKRHIQRALLQAIARAERRAWLTTPYFVPPPRLLKALVAARKRGVEVSVLTAGISDVPIAAAAARHLYGSLLRAGVRVLEMEKRTLHAKTATIDGTWSLIGSFNLDRWSFERNLEVCFSALAPDLAQSLEEVFSADRALCREVRLSEWQGRTLWERVKGFLAYQLMRL
jgi:cardiolipin synthase